MKRAAANYGGISSAAVKKATGRTWSQWLTLLDQAGARKLPSRGVAQRLASQHRLVRKLTAPEAAAKTKAYWTGKLEALRAFLKT
jgi:hypothetical protein